MKNYFSFSELCISDDRVPLHVCDKLLRYHIVPMNRVRKILGYWITASERSGFRPYLHELKMGRSGESQHTFGDEKDDQENWLGAVDWTCANFAINSNDFLNMIVNHHHYTRISIYNTFLHCDYAHDNNKEVQIFKQNYELKKWQYIKTILK